MSLQKEVLVIGYVREHAKLFDLVIPHDLFIIFLLFYQRTYRLYGIGPDGDNELGLTELRKNKDYDPWDTKKNWEYLSAISKLCQHYEMITFGSYNTFIQNDDNIYAIGRNDDGSLGVNKPDQPSIQQFTQILFDDENVKSSVIDLISEGIWHN